jgi:hypothetical protein
MDALNHTADRSVTTKQTCLKRRSPLYLENGVGSSGGAGWA